MKHPKIFLPLLAVFLLTLFSGCKHTEDKKLKPREGYIQVPGGKVWYRIVGSGDKTPILLLHGGPGVPGYYLNPIAELGKDRPVIFFDQLGCGRSDKITDTTLMTMEHYIEEVKTVRDSLGLEEFFIYGQSWGTMLGADYYLKYPEGVKGIVFSSPALSIKKWMEDAQVLVATLPDSLQQIIKVNEAANTYNTTDYQRAMKAYYELYVARKLPWSTDIDSSFSEMAMNVYLYMEGPSEFTITGTIKDYDRTPQLSEIKVPVLYITGQYDEARPSTVQYYQSVTPGSEYAEIPDAGHMTMQDNKAEHNKVLERFLEKVEEKKLP